LPGQSPSAGVHTRSVSYRDRQDARIFHKHVFAFHGSDECEKEKADQVALSSIGIGGKDGSDFGIPSRPSEKIVAYAHFVLARCDLATTGKEMKCAIADVSEAFSAHSEIAAKSIKVLMDEMDEYDIEDSMDAADDRWVDQIATLDNFITCQELNSADLYEACFRELLPLTNSTSGLLIAARYPCPGDQDAKHAATQIDLFKNDETELRTISKIYPDQERDDMIWIITGMAQISRQVEACIRARLNLSDET
jgi:hypothetical protein